MDGWMKRRKGRGRKTEKRQKGESKDARGGRKERGVGLCSFS